MAAPLSASPSAGRGEVVLHDPVLVRGCADTGVSPRARSWALVGHVFASDIHPICFASFGSSCSVKSLARNARAKVCRSLKRPLDIRSRSVQRQFWGRLQQASTCRSLAVIFVEISSARHHAPFPMCRQSQGHVGDLAAGFEGHVSMPKPARERHPKELFQEEHWQRRLPLQGIRIAQSLVSGHSIPPSPYHMSFQTAGLVLPALHVSAAPSTWSQRCGPDGTSASESIGTKRLYGTRG